MVAPAAPPKGARERMAAALRDATLRHAIDLHKYSNSVTREILMVLRAADVALLDRLAGALERLTEHASTFRIQRADEVLSGVRGLVSQAYSTASARLDTEMRSFTEHELSHQTRAAQRALPEGTALATPSSEQVIAAATARPFQGRLMGEWFSGLGDRLQQRVRDVSVQGVVQGKTVGEMMKEVRAVLPISANHAESVVRTSVAHYAAEARDSFFSANSDVFNEQQWLSTLDNRTTPECQVRDGLHYTLDGEPIGHKVPWLEGPGEIHWGCRSVAVPVVKIVGLDLGPAMRASKEGPVSSKMGYAEWLSSQSSAVQDEVLGPKRGAMYRAGSVSFTRFFNDKGQRLTLDQLKGRTSGN